MLGCIPT
jgi:DNA-binding NarL/FixJ family response regulator